MLRLQERPGCRSRPWRSGCSSGWPPRPGWCCGWRACGPSSRTGTGSCRRAPGSWRARGVGVIEAQDAERSRLERDIHDGAQQHLVALAVNLRLAQVVAVRSPERAHQVLAEQAEAAAARHRHAVVAEPRDLPPDAARSRDSSRRCGPASAAARSRSPSRPRPAAADRRRSLEAALYFCCMEAVQNAAKHSGADPRDGAPSATTTDRWCLDVTDDGVGLRRGARARRRSGRRSDEHARPAGRRRRHRYDHLPAGAGHRRQGRRAGSRAGRLNAPRASPGASSR